MAPVAVPDTSSCTKSPTTLPDARRPARPPCTAPRPLAGRIFVGLRACRECRQRLDDFLLAVDHLGQAALAIEVAVLVEADVHQDPGIFLRRQLDALHGRGKGLRIELADL